MRSARLAKAIAKGTVFVRNNRTGQVLVQFRSPNTKDRLFSPVPLKDQNKKESYINLSRLYSAEQLIASTLEDLILAEDLELGNF
jgi:hypothetical protein